MSPRKCQTFDIPSTTSELTTNKTNPDYSRRKSMPADMHHREGESTAGPQTNMVDTVVGARSNIADTAVGAAPLFYKRSELIKDVRHVDDDDDQLSVEIPFDIPTVAADPGAPRLVTPGINNGSLQQQQQQQYPQQYPSPNKVSPPKTESLINQQRIQGHAPYYSNNPNATSHHYLTNHQQQQKQQQQQNLSLVQNQYSHHHNTTPISLPVTAADINHHRPKQQQPQSISVQRQATLNVTQAQLPARAIPSPRSSPTPPNMRTTRQQEQPTVSHIQQFSFGPSTGKQHKGSHAIGGGNTSQRK